MKNCQTFLPERNTVKTTMWRQSQTNNSRPLLSPEATVKKAQANNEQVVSIFFDMEKAYVLTWRHSILMDISEAGIEGRILIVI